MTKEEIFELFMERVDDNDLEDAFRHCDVIEVFNILSQIVYDEIVLKSEAAVTSEKE
jgi:hypothetical protein